MRFWHLSNLFLIVVYCGIWLALSFIAIYGLLFLAYGWDAVIGIGAAYYFFGQLGISYLQLYIREIKKMGIYPNIIKRV